MLDLVPLDDRFNDCGLFGDGVEELKADIYIVGLVLVEADGTDADHKWGGVQVLGFPLKLVGKGHHLSHLDGNVFNHQGAVYCQVFQVPKQGFGFILYRGVNSFNFLRGLFACLSRSTHAGLNE